MSPLVIPPLQKDQALITKLGMKNKGVKIIHQIKRVRWRCEPESFGQKSEFTVGVIKNNPLSGIVDVIIKVTIHYYHHPHPHSEVNSIQHNKY